MKSLYIAAIAVWSWVGLASPAAADSWGHKDRPEARVQRMLERLRGDPPQLRAFLEQLPKGPTFTATSPVPSPWKS